MSYAFKVTVCDLKAAAHTLWVTKCAFPALLAYTTQLASRLQNATLKMSNQINELNPKVTNCDLKDVVAGE